MVTKNAINSTLDSLTLTSGSPSITVSGAEFTIQNNATDGALVVSDDTGDLWALDETLGSLSRLQFRRSQGLITASTSDGADNAFLNLCGGGGFGFSRGAYITLAGNEGGGDIFIVPGNVAGGRVNMGNAATAAFGFNNGTKMDMTMVNATVQPQIIFDDDTGYLDMCGGQNILTTEGSYISVRGVNNGHLAGEQAGQLRLAGGEQSAGTSGSIIFLTHSNTERWHIQQDGHLVPQASGSYNIGASGTPVGTIYADEVISQGSPGLRLTHEAGHGIVDTTEDNDLRLRRNGVSILQLESDSALFTGNVTVQGSITAVSGVTSLVSEQLLIEDNIITLNSTASGTPTLDSGIEVNRGSSDYARLLWDESEDYWIAGISGSETRILVSSGVEEGTNSLQPVVDQGMSLGSSGKRYTDVYVDNLHLNSNSIFPAADDSFVKVAGGTDGSSVTGARMEAYGNDGGTTPGSIVFKTGTSATGENEIEFHTSEGGNSLLKHWVVASGGAFQGQGSSAIETTSSSLFLGGNSETRLGTNNTLQLRLNTSNQFYPQTTNTMDLGSSSQVFNAIYVNNMASRTTEALTVESRGGLLTLSGSGGMDLTTPNDILISPNNVLRWFFDNSDGNFHPNGQFQRDIGNSSNHLLRAYTSEIRRDDGSSNSLLLTNTSATGNVRVQVNSINQVTFAAAGRKTFFQSSSQNEIGLYMEHENTSYANSMLYLDCARSASSSYNFLRARSSQSDNEFLLRGDGVALSDGGAMSGPADYAEFFESVSGTALPVGSTVVLDGDKVRNFNPEIDEASQVIGVVRPKGSGISIVGNHPLNWHKKYQRDAYGRYILDENGDRILSEGYDPDQEYQLRESRDEWNLIGLLGQVPVDKDQTKNPAWVQMKEVTAEVDMYFIK